MVELPLNNNGNTGATDTDNQAAQSAQVQASENTQPDQAEATTAMPAPAAQQPEAPAPQQEQEEKQAEDKTTEGKDDKKPTPTPAQREEELQQAIVANNVSQFVQVLMSYAIEQGTSDIHIEPMMEAVRVRFRIDGVLRRIIEYPQNLHPAVIARVKIVSNLKIDEQRLPQDGRTQLVTDTGKEMDVRVSTLPTVNGEKVCMRLQDKSRDIPNFQQLGIMGNNLKVLEKTIKSPNGVFLVTGPTGSGKTTTLYSALQKLNVIEDNIMTCEDPVEYQMDGLNQAQMKPEIGLDFAAGLRTALRQDPDIIMVGEIRDLETVDIAVRAALTGHFVLSTIHTNSACETITRLIDMGAKPFLIASAVRAFLAQRLVRKICDNCKEEFSPAPELVEKVKKDLSGYIPASDEEKALIENPKFYKGKGCDVCGGSGYKGRLGIYEALEMSANLQRMVVQEKSAQEIQEYAVKEEGLVILKVDGLLKAMMGRTTLDEVYDTVG